MVRVLTCDTKSRGFYPGFVFSGNNLGQVVHTHTHTCASVTKQYNLVPAAGKVIVGLASHWPCVTDSSGLSTYGRRAHSLRKGDEHPAYALLWSMANLHLPYLSCHKRLGLPAFTSSSCRRNLAVDKDGR